MFQDECINYLTGLYCFTCFYGLLAELAPFAFHQLINVNYQDPEATLAWDQSQSWRVETIMNLEVGRMLFQNCASIILIGRVHLKVDPFARWSSIFKNTCFTLFS